MLSNHELLGLLSVLISLSATGHYLYLIVTNKAKPHLFSWVIWTLIIGISATARTVSDAGPGAWAPWAGCFSTFMIGLFALFKGERNITRADTIFFVSALAAIPLWIATKSPFAAVCLVSLIDLLGFLPTMRKSYIKPFEEPIYNHLVAVIMQFLSLSANEVQSWTNVLTPLTVIVCSSTLLTIIIWRRKTTQTKVS